MTQTFPNNRHTNGNGRGHAQASDGLTSVSRGSSSLSRPTPPQSERGNPRSMPPSPPRVPRSGNALPPQKPEGTGEQPGMNLRNKMALFATLLGIVPAIAVGSGVYYLANRALMDEHRAVGKAQVEALQTDATALLGERLADLQLMAGLSLFANAAERLETPRTEKSATLNRLLAAHPIYQGLAVFDRNGTAIAQAGDISLSNAKGNAAFQQVLQRNSAAILPTAVAADGTRSLEIAVPVNDAGSGSVVGVVFARLAGADVAGALATNLVEGTEVYVLGPNGEIWLASDGAIAAGTNGAAAAGQAPSPAITTLFPDLKPLQAGSEAEATLLKNAQTDESQFVAQAPPAAVEGSPDLALQTVIAQDRTQLLASRTPFWLALAAGTGVAALLGGAIATWLARRTTHPIAAANETLERIGRGNLNARLEMEGNPELAQLGSNINRLVSQFQSSLQTQASALEQANFLVSVASESRDLSTRELTNASHQILEDARQFLGVDRVVIYRFNEDWTGYILSEAVAPGWPVALNDAIEDACIPESLLTAYRNGRVVTNADVFNAGFHPEHVALMERLKIKANLVVPVLNQGRLFGLLVAHHCAKLYTWQEQEIHFLQQLATQVGITLDLREVEAARQNAEALAATIQVESERSQTLKNITAQIAQSLEVQAIFNTTVREIRQAMGADRALVYTFNENWQGTIIAEAVTGGWPRSLGAEIADPCFAKDYVEKYQRGRVQATNDIYDAGLTPCHLQQLEPFAVRANLVAPIISGGELLGLLVAHQCSGPRQWEASETDFFAQLAVQVGFALDRAKLLEKTEASAAEARLLAERAQMLKNITTQIAQSLESEAIFNTAVREIRQAMAADRTIVYTFDKNWKGTIIAEAVVGGWPRALGAEIADPCFAKDYVSKYQRGRVQATNDIYDAGLTDCHLQQLEPFAVRANLVAPIISGGELLGLLISHQCSGPRQWEASEQAFFSQLATQVGFALDRSKLLQQAEVAAAQAQLLAEVTSTRDRKNQNLDDIFEQALDRARTLMKVDRIVIYRFNEDWSGYISGESVAVGWPRALNDAIEDACIPANLIEDYLRGRVVTTNDVFNAGFHPDHEKLMERLKIKANLVTPIVRQGRLFGLLIAHHCATVHSWQEGEVTFLSQLASQLGAALDRTTFISQVEEARQTAEVLAAEQKQLKEGLQQRALSLLMEVDPVSQGDLTVRAKVTEDEIGTIADSYNATVESLRRLVLQVQATAEQMASTTGNNDRFVQGLSAGALQQSAEIETALKRLQEMNQSIRAVAASAGQAETVVRQASQTAQEGDAAMNRTVEGIMAIRETVAETAKKVKRLGESSQKISKVVNLIGSFAAQTNLLALNASIEAARAGEEGRGFAVVAEEVRSLARQSAEATSEIEKLVTDIQTETNDVVTAMESGTEQVVRGSQMVDDTRLSLTKITAASDQINELVEAIAQATVVQSQASEAVTHTMTGVAAISDDTSEKATQVSQSFKQLLALAQDMQDSVGQFKV